MWLSNISTKDAGRPPITGADTTLFIVESWIPPRNGTNRSIHVYTNLATVELYVNGALVGPAQRVPYFGAASFNIQYSAGNLTAVGRDASGQIQARTSKFTPGVAMRLALSLDAPAVSTGTGSALLADGEDTALIRASVLDGHGNVVHSSGLNITFRVESGPGRIWATHNGDPANRSPPHAPWDVTYHGLVRAFVRSNADHATPPRHREVGTLSFAVPVGCTN